MSLLSIVIIAFGLAMDAFAVSISSGISMRKCQIADALKIGSFFGGFQGLMPVIGWSAGQYFKTLIEGVDHWIAFALLFAIGTKMIYESSKMSSNKNKVCKLNFFMLFLLSIATSIDALAVGLSLSFLDISIIYPALFIGIVTFVLSFFGLYIGSTFGHFFEKRIELFGGLLLIGIGVKILIEHLGFA